MTPFSSVYRLQLSRSFPLKKATALLPYLKELGLDAVYCSPYYDACSSHGYDVTNPNQLNPALGSEDDFDIFCQTLKKLKMGQIIDVIPNHMGIKEGKNAWWQDVLQNGPNSAYASFFDINFTPDKKELQNKVLLPILGDSYGAVLERQEIQLNHTNGAFYITYGTFVLPIAPHTTSMIAQYLPNSNDESKKALGEVCTLFNGKKRDPRSFDLLDALLEAQVYRLAYWKVASHEINYRRFFNIHELVAIRIEEQHVLKAHHQWVFELLEEGKVQGLRIDHPDGLYDPDQYFERLRKRFSVPTVVEKILDRKEALPSSWAVDGTVGYEYLNILSGVFVRQDQEELFTSIYEQFIGEKMHFETLLYEKKKLFTQVEMVSEMEALGLHLDRISEKSRYFRDFTRHDLTLALQEVIACFPVYRTYIAPNGGVSKTDAKIIADAVKKAKSRGNHLDPSIFSFLEKLLLLKLKSDEKELQGYRDFILKFQQLTAPIMAKGLEDTTFYIYNRFISLNEVGGDPPHFGRSVKDFHQFNQEKLANWPLGFLPSSTHDTKRSEDVRMRLNVLTEMGELWKANVKKWAALNAKHKTKSKRGMIPSSNTEYFIYQTLIGVWPRVGSKKNLFERLWTVILKSIREARVDTNWIEPNQEVEEGTKQFLLALLAEEKGNLFLKYFLPFQKQIDRLGGWNSLSMVALKMASCGIVDIYQGSETYDYCLVDPDNRRTVDFSLRSQILSTVKKTKNTPEKIKKLFDATDLGKLKCLLHTRALQFRSVHKELFCKGEYIPLKVRGQCKDHIIAFYRKNQETAVVVLVGRFFASLKIAPWELPLGRGAWGDTEVLLSGEWGGRLCSNLFTGEEVLIKKHKPGSSIKIAETFTTLPLAYLIPKARNDCLK